ncbi:MAG: hypothetical protein AUI33_11435 [Ignavibacteria bacterium 13_1_40CM_2_61_4]|nr:MAG: hypothetical protein AUI33_11435 [Ignavibacteria bacterium 13_1_40CM_2_61_4]
MNAGGVWTTQPSGSVRSITGIRFSDFNNGWAVGTGGEILRTFNGGLNWTKLHRELQIQSNLLAVSFPDAADGWAVGIGGVVAHTNDGGASWSIQASGTTRYLTGVSFTDNLNGWICGRSGVLLKTTDGGGGWAGFSTGSRLTYNAIQFVNPNTGFIAANTGKILRTTNGGASWTSLSTRSGKNIYGVFFLNPSRGWAVGAGGVVSATTTGRAFRHPKSWLGSGGPRNHHTDDRRRVHLDHPKLLGDSGPHRDPGFQHHGRVGIGDRRNDPLFIRRRHDMGPAELRDDPESFRARGARFSERMGSRLHRRNSEEHAARPHLQHSAARSDHQTFFGELSEPVQSHDDDYV